MNKVADNLFPPKENLQAVHIPYRSTGFFSKLVVDYLENAASLQPFYQYENNLDGIRQSIEARKKVATNRTLLIEVLQQQFAGIALSEKQQAHLNALANPNCFTITTAHQPNIFTGPLYLIYKIVHAIKMADELKKTLPEYDFVPIYYMGSEDADLDELGYIQLQGKKLSWQTNQTGAVGRMKVDKALLLLITEIAGQIGIHPFGNELIAIFKEAYQLGRSIQEATLLLVNSLFASEGLLVIIPDSARLKNSFAPIIKKELVEQFSFKAVSKTITELKKEYKVQAAGRTLNLFYLIDDKRERIVFENNLFSVESLSLSWTLETILAELSSNPERFSPNVILRGLFQETILPNIAFIGGGGELAYWLELKEVFAEANVPYPLLVLRNSFLLVDEHQKRKLQKHVFNIVDYFLPELELVNKYVVNQSQNQLTLSEEIIEFKNLYAQIHNKASVIDQSLKAHVAFLETNTLKKIATLEKKLLRAEKRKFTDATNQLISLKQSLFPNNNLQEREENFSTLYATHGKDWLKTIYQHSLWNEQLFTVLI